MMDPLYQSILDESKLVKDRVKLLQESISLYKGNCAWILLVLFLRKNEKKGIQDAIKKGLISIRENLPPKIQAMIKEIIFEKELPFFPKRAIAANLLGRLNALDAVEILLQIVKDNTENRFTRSSAAEALGELQFQPACEILIQTLQNELEDVRVRAAAAMALSWMKEERVLPLLFQLLQHQDTTIWNVAIDALTNFHQSSITGELLHLYSRNESFEDNFKKRRFRDALLARDLVVFLESSSDSLQLILKELIIDQENVNLQQLEFIKDHTEKNQLKILIGEILAEIQPKVQNTEGFEFLI